MDVSGARPPYILPPPHENIWKNQVIRLNAAAETGDIDALYAVLKQNPFILQKIDEVPFIETPLHIAAKHGEPCFVAEIAKLKPSFATKLNQDGFSPLHLASENDHVQVLKELVKVNPNLCLLKGRENMTPLHLAAVVGSINALRELLSVCFESIRELTVRNETAVHLAVKNGKLDALKVLVKELLLFNEHMLVFWEDREGNTAMQLSQTSDQLQMVRLLSKVPGKRRKGPRRPPPLVRWTHWFIDISPFIEPGKDRDALIVIAVLIATVTFQIGVNPPGGVWQDNYFPSQNHNNSANACNNTIMASEKAHVAGTAILATRSKLYFNTLMLANSGAFFFSMIIIFIIGYVQKFSVITPILPLLWSTYFCSVVATTPRDNDKNELGRFLPGVIYYITAPLCVACCWKLRGPLAYLLIKD